MSSKFLVRIVVLLAVVALAVPVMAKPISKTFNISQPAKLGSSTLSIGEYRLLIDGTKVTVQRSGKVVAEVQGHLEQRETKAHYNSVLLGSQGELREIRFAGDNRVLVFTTQ